MDILLDQPGSPPITSVSMWIGTYADGTEGVISVDLPLLPGVQRHMPLMHTRREVAERFRPVAEKAWQMQLGRKFERIELRTFVREA